MTRNHPAHVAPKGPHRFDGGGPGSAPLALLAASVVLGGSRQALAATGTLLVYLHVSVKQRAFQGLLGAGLAGVTTTAVGRIADFERALQDAPDAVLTLPMVLSARRLTPALRGVARGSVDERYSLLGPGNVPEPNRVASVGALDILGRDGTNQFVKAMVGAQARVERVTKVEDLLPLLQMQRVDTVLLPARLVAELRASSRLPLSERELPTLVGLAAAASLGPNGSAVLAAVKKMPKELSKLLGVEEWR